MNTPKITNLAQLKRYAKVGVRLRLVWRIQGGGCEEMREVTKTQGNAVVFRGEVRGELKDGLWLHWPKSKEVTFDEKGFEVLAVKPGEEPERRLRYEYVAEGEPTPPTAHQRLVATLQAANAGWPAAFTDGYALGMVAAQRGDEPDAHVWFSPADHPTNEYVRAAGYRSAFMAYARDRAIAWEKARTFHAGDRVQIDPARAWGAGVREGVTLTYVRETWTNRGRVIEVEHRRPDGERPIRQYNAKFVTKAPLDAKGCRYGLKELPPEYVHHGPVGEGEGPKDGDVWWCGVNPPPVIGDRVKVRINEFGEGEVVSYFHEHGFLGVEVRVDHQPRWHRLKHGHCPYVLVFAIELEGQCRASQTTSAS